MEQEDSQRLIFAVTWQPFWLYAFVDCLLGVVSSTHTFAGCLWCLIELEFGVSELPAFLFGLVGELGHSEACLVECTYYAPVPHVHG